MTIRLDCFGLTDRGRECESNQDQFLIGDLRKSLEVFQTSLNVDDHERIFGGSQGKLLIVADGMGSEPAGERASALALDTLSTYALNSLHWFFRLQEDSDEEFVAELKDAMEKCQNSIRAEAQRISAVQGMGTTLTMAYVIWPRVYVLHAGDSRCYLFRASKLWQITRDHTLGQELIDERIVSEENKEQSSLSHVLWNCVGTTDDVQPCAHRAELVANDALLLCTDGLTNHLRDQEIEQILQDSPTSELACNRLVEAANRAGGTDNITVVLARFEEFGTQQALVMEAAISFDSGPETIPPEEELTVTLAEEAETLT